MHVTIAVKQSQSSAVRYAIERVIRWPSKDFMYNICQGGGSLGAELRPCKFHYLSNINEGLVLLKLAGIVLSLINNSPCYVKRLTVNAIL